MKGFSLFLLWAFCLLSSGKSHAGESQSLEIIRSLLTKKQPSHAELDSLNKLFTVYFGETIADQSTIELAHEVLQINIAAGYQVGQGDALKNLTKVSLGAGHIAEAMDYAQQSYSIYNQLGDKFQMGMAKMNIGIAYYQMENFSKSILLYEEALSLFNRSGNLEKNGTILYLMGIDYSRMGQYDKAQRCFMEALEHNLRSGDQQRIAECRTQIATMFIDQGKPDQALPYITPSLEYAYKTNNRYGVALSCNLLAMLYLQKHQPDSALIFATTASRNADNTGNISLIKDVNHTLYQVNKELGNYESAMLNLEKFMTYKDSVFNDRNSRLISQFESQQLHSKNQNRILLLEKEKKNRDLQLKGSIIIGLMFLLLFVVLYSRYVIRQRANRELETAYDDLRRTQEQLISHEKMASLGQLTAGIAHEIKNPLNFVNNFSAMSLELIQDLKSSGSEHERKEILKDLSINLEKIKKHGERADSIVKNMLDHSRTGNSDKEPHDLNKLCEDYFNLSYQGIRAQNPLFACDLEVSLDPQMPPVNLAGQEISRVLINIFNNGFYAIQKKSLQNPDYRPAMSLVTNFESGFAVIRIRDNGTGIPKRVKDKIFEPFFTTKPSGEGTGLGLSISYEIISSHGGQMEVDSEENQFTQFTIKLPVT